MKPTVKYLVLIKPMIPVMMLKIGEKDMNTFSYIIVCHILLSASSFLTNISLVTDILAQVNWCIRSYFFSSRTLSYPVSDPVGSFGTPTDLPLAKLTFSGSHSFPACWVLKASKSL